MKFNKIVCSCFLVSFLLLIESEIQAEKLKVGFIGGFSGIAQIYGEAAKNGLLLGLPENYKEKYEIIFEDDQFNPSKSVTAFKKLVELDRVKLLFSLGSGPSNALAPLAEKHQIPLLAWASDSKVSKGRQFVIRSWASGFEEGEKLAKAVKDFKYSKIAYAQVTGDYASSVYQGFVASVPPEQVEIFEEFLPETTSFVPFLMKAKSRQLDAIGICLNPGQISQFARQARDLKLKAQIFGCETLNDQNEIANAKGALAGAWFETGYVADWFIDKYKQTYGRQDMLSGAAVFHDIAKTILPTLNSDLNSSQIMKKIESVKFTNGALGEYGIADRSADLAFKINLVLRKIDVDGSISQFPSS